MPENIQEIQGEIVATMRNFTEKITTDAASLHTLRLSPEQLALLLATWPTERPVAVLTLYAQEKNQQLTSHITAWQTLLGTSARWHVIDGPPSEQEQEGSISTQLTESLHHFLGNSPLHRYIVAQSALTQPIPNPAQYQSLVRTLHRGERVSLATLRQLFASHGFIRHTKSLEPGSFIIRGEQLEFWHPSHNPYRLTLYGAAIEQIVEISGKRSWSRPHVAVPPLRFPAADTAFKETVKNFVVFRPQLMRDSQGADTIVYDAPTAAHEFPLKAFSPTTQDSTAREIFFLAHNLDRATQYVRTHYPDRAVYIASTPASSIPIAWENENYAVLTEAAVFAEQQETAQISYREGIALLAELQEGRPAVHSDHGIGIYEGLHARNFGGLAREYIVVRYADGDLLSVPVELAYKVTAYVGDTAPTIHKLGGSLWLKTRRQARRDAEAFARELVTIAHAREQSTREPFFIDPTLEESLTASFPYTLTEGQTEAWAQVQRDFTKPVPTDRVIVGDVGFGKTEIAIRAAAHAVANGRQVAVLAPTTLLVQQHFDTFVQRLAPVPVQVAMLSRFTTPAEQKKVRQSLAQGTSQIAVGTHALLSASTRWKNLGLVIIDEEQRFGVSHKEHFKKLRAAVDIVSLSATPIPRTLSMALTGLKGLSVIASPPPGRRDVQSYVGKDSDVILEQAIEKELARQGQVYVVLPRIRGLASTARRITALFPHATIALAHGQLPSRHLAQIMHEFDAGKLQILVSSTIVENGLDLPNANTLIVLQATHFGLAELYQLRGRVGRRARQGYAYFLYGQQELTSLQRERLTVLTETSRVGSGWALAQRDLELRGAGNVLGAEQSGTVNAVGVQLYLDMVHDVLLTEEGGATARREVEMQVPFPTYIPAHYVADLQTRLRYYQQLSRATQARTIDDLSATIVATYGPLPVELHNFILVLKLQLAAGVYGITKISYRLITPPDEAAYHRLLIDSNDPVPLLGRLAALGNWTVRGTSLQRDVSEITPDLLSELKHALVSKTTTN